MMGKVVALTLLDHTRIRVTIENTDEMSLDFEFAYGEGHDFQLGDQVRVDVKRLGSE